MVERNEDDRKAGHVQFSSHRGGPRHRVRYVESPAPPAGECRLCVGSLAGDSANAGAGSQEAKPAEKESVDEAQPGKD
ncbi:hypothetical protein A3754_07135 [Alcanivorax sp. HI0083]|uniref:hypothetical protein n=2 Tax=Alcanivorax TaxID=59753 RepID=UPI0007B96F9A|nr:MULTISPECIES: hypothetical protein [unclassified Alcanivorax]KZY34517.1 hypothetical protein A3730_16360 [Alcanivorax sp. HI0044]KZZ27607.1 hypothetical protein A3754_07135 [Alcanivorax sp. HI0083]